MISARISGKVTFSLHYESERLYAQTTPVLLQVALMILQLRTT